jgi:hypothetical protein
MKRKKKSRSLENVEITEHAIFQFYKRVVALGMTPPADVEQTRQCIVELLKKAKPDSKISEARKVQRIISNKFKEANYYLSGGWRLIIVNEKVVTIERKKSSEN